MKKCGWGPLQIDRSELISMNSSPALCWRDSTAKLWEQLKSDKVLGFFFPWYFYECSIFKIWTLKLLFLFMLHWECHESNFVSEKINCFTYMHTLVYNNNKNKFKSEHKMEVFWNYFCLLKDILFYISLTRRSVMMKSMKTIVPIQIIRWMNNTCNDRIKYNY